MSHTYNLAAIQDWLRFLHSLSANPVHGLSFRAWAVNAYVYGGYPGATTNYFRRYVYRVTRGRRMTRIELCWGCQNALGAVHIHARPPHARLIGGGWQRWHPTCVPATYDTAEPRVEDDPDKPCCRLHVYSIVPWGACCDPNDCGPCCANCPTCPTLIRVRTVQAQL